MRGLIDGLADQAIPRTNVGGHFAGLPVALDNGVAVTVRGPGGEYRMCGRYLVACDGGHSTVRKLTGVAFPGRAGTLAAVSADVELTALSATAPRRAEHISRLTRTGGGYWMLLHPLEGPRGEHRLVPGRVRRAGAGHAAP